MPTDKECIDDLSLFFGEAKKKFPGMIGEIDKAVKKIESHDNVKLDTSRGFSTPQERAEKAKREIEAEKETVIKP